MGGCQALTAHLSHNMPAQGQGRLNSAICCSIQITGLGKGELRLGGSSSSSSAQDHAKEVRLLHTKLSGQRGIGTLPSVQKGCLETVMPVELLGAKLTDPRGSRKHGCLQHRCPLPRRGQAPCPGCPCRHQDRAVRSISQRSPKMCSLPGHSRCCWKMHRSSCLQAVLLFMADFPVIMVTVLNFMSGFLCCYLYPVLN